MRETAAGSCFACCAQKLQSKNHRQKHTEGNHMRDLHRFGNELSVGCVLRPQKNCWSNPFLSTFFYVCDMQRFFKSHFIHSWMSKWDERRSSIIWISFCYLLRIQGILVWEVSEFSNIVKFLDTPLYLSIQKFHQNANRLKFLNFQKSFHTFQVTKLLKRSARNKAFVNNRDKMSHHVQIPQRI